MGAPIYLVRKAQVPAGIQHFSTTIKALKTFAFESSMGASIIRKEPIGVCSLITPRKWPLNQIATKVAPAIAAAYTMILKPSEVAPLSAILLTEIIHQAKLPQGVFNLVHGAGEQIGKVLR